MTTKHKLETGWTLVEEDLDIWGRVAVFAVENTPWRCVRLEKGWRAQKAPTGHQRRKYVGPAWESAPQVVRYLLKHGYMHGMTP